MPTAQKLSLLWVFVLFNMAFADILGFIYPGFLAMAATGVLDGIAITPGFLLVAALFLEIPIAMVVLSVLLRRPVSRIANLVAAPVTILFVVGGGSLQPHYVFLAGMEVLAMLAIAYLAWTWTEEGSSGGSAS